MVRAAARNEVDFDREFAVRVLTEVLKIEQSIERLRNFVSYVTVPLEFIPVAGSVVKKVVEEAVVHTVAHKRKKKHQWFYLISEMAERSHKG